MTATKMNAQEIIQFIANAEKKTSVKVTFEGQLATAVPSSVVKLGNVLFGDWKDVAPLLDGLVENQDYVVEQDARNSAVPLLDKRAINARIEPGAIIRDQVEIGDKLDNFLSVHFCSSHKRLLVHFNDTYSTKKGLKFEAFLFVFRYDF